MDLFAHPTARFYCNWLGPFSSAPVGIPGEGSHTFDVIMVGVQADQIAAVASGTRTEAPRQLCRLVHT